MNKCKLALILVLSGVMVVITACGAGAKASENPDPERVGDPAIGAELFVERHGEVPACSFCHAVSGNDGGIGPSLEGIASRAGQQVDGMDAVAYLRESIIEPNAFIADGSRKSRMYAHFGDILSDEEIDHLIAYLLTLK